MASAATQTSSSLPFSGASPILDDSLAMQSGQNDGACSATAGRQRYDLSAGDAASAKDGEQAAGG